MVQKSEKCKSQKLQQSRNSQGQKNAVSEYNAVTTSCFLIHSLLA